MAARRVLLAFVAAVLALGACGNDGDSADADADAVRAAIAAFEQRVRADGFALDTDDDDDDDDVEFTSEECKKFEDAFPDAAEDLPGATADLDSKSFTRGALGPGGGAEESLEASAGLVEESEDLDELFGLMRDAQMKPCLAEAFQAGFQQGVAEEGIDVSVNNLVVDLVDVAGVGDEATRFQVSAVIAAQGVEFPFAGEFSFARQGRAAASVSAFIIGTDKLAIPSDDLLRQILDDLADSA